MLYFKIWKYFRGALKPIGKQNRCTVNNSNYTLTIVYAPKAVLFYTPWVLVASFRPFSLNITHFTSKKNCRTLFYSVVVVVFFLWFYSLNSSRWRLLFYVCIDLFVLLYNCCVCAWINRLTILLTLSWNPISRCWLVATRRESENPITKISNMVDGVHENWQNTRHQT